MWTKQASWWCDKVPIATGNVSWNLPMPGRQSDVISTVRCNMWKLGFSRTAQKKIPWFCEPDFVKNPLLMWRLWQRGLSWDVGLKQVWTCLLVWVEWCLNFKKTLKHKLKKKSPSKYGLFQIEVSNVQERNDGCTTLHHGCTKLWTSSLETQLGVLQKQL